MIKTIFLMIIGAIIKSAWDFFALRRNEKMFYSTEFLKLQVLKLNLFIKKLALFKKLLVELQFAFLKENKIDISDFNKRMFVAIAEIDNTLTNLSFFINKKRHDNLRKKFDNIFNLTKKITNLLDKIIKNSCKEENITKDLDKIIYEYDCIIKGFKQCLKAIIPKEYFFREEADSIIDVDAINIDKIIEEAYKKNN